MALAMKLSLDDTVDIFPDEKVSVDMPPNQLFVALSAPCTPKEQKVPNGRKGN